MEQTEKETRIKAVCPYCGYTMPVQYNRAAKCNGVFVSCKGRSCHKIFELRIENGKQVK